MLRQVGIVLLWLVGGLVLLAVVLFIYAQTPLAKEQISRALSERLSEPPNRTEIQGLAGLLPFDVEVGSVTLEDDGGEWLQAEKIRIRLSPAELLQGRLHARELGAERIRIERRPAGTGKQEEAADRVPAATGLPRLSLPTSLPPLSVDRFYVNRIETAPPVLGTSARFRLEGSLTTETENRMRAQLSLERTDRTTSSARLQASLDLSAPEVAVDMKATVDDELMSGVLGRPGTGPLELSFSGSGPPDRFAARLHLAGKNFAKLDAELALSAGERRSLRLEGTFEPAPGVLPPAYAELVGRSAGVALAVQEKEGGAIELERLDIESALLEVTGSGALLPRDNRIEGEITARVADLAKLSGIAGIPLGGRLSLTGRTDAGSAEPRIRLSVAGSDLRFRDLRAPTLSGMIELTPTAPIAEGFRGLRASGGLTLEGVARGTEVLTAFQKVDVSLDLLWTGQESLTVHRLALEAPDLRLDAEGRLDPAAGSGTFDLAGELPKVGELLRTLLPDRSELKQLGGGLSARSTVQLADGFRRLEAGIDAKGRQLAGLPQPLDRLLGVSPTLHAVVTRSPKPRTEIRELRLEGEKALVEGDLSLAGKKRQLDGRLRLRLRDMAPLSPLLGADLSGAAELLVMPRGPLASPSLELQVESAPLSLAGRRFDRLKAHLTADRLPAAPRGELAATLEAAGKELRLAGSFGYQEDRLRLEKVRLNGPSTEGKLDLTLTRKPLALDGRLELRSTDLAALRPWHGQELAGSLDLALRLEAADHRENATVVATLEKLRAPFGDLARAHLEAKFADLFAAPAGNGTLDIEQLRRPGLTISSGQLRFRGPLSDLVLEADLTGRTRQSFDVVTQARLALDPKRQALTLEKLSGTLGDQKLALRRPAHAVLEKGVLRIDRLDLFIGKGTIRGELDTGDRTRFARLQGKDLPLSVLAAYVDLPAQGRFDFGLSVDPSPELRLDATIRDFRAEDLYGTDIPRYRFVLRSRLRNGRLDAGIEATAAGVPTSRLRAELPVAWPALGAPLRLLHTAPVRGRADLRLPIGLLAALLHVRDQYLTGELESRSELSGTLAKPKLRGVLKIHRGGIEDAVSGMVIRDIEAELQARGERIEILRFTGRDRRDGTVRIKGGVRSPTLLEPAYDLRLEADRFELWNTAFATATGSARLRLAGTTVAADLTGNIAVKRAEVRLLARTAASIPEIEVVEVGDGEHARQDAPPPSDGSALPVLRLDVGIDAPRRLFVRGGGLESEWAGKLRIEGIAPAVAVRGEIEARRAELDLLGRRFHLRKGRISFTGGVPPEPMIDLVAEARSADVTALFHLVGPLDHPRLILESEPPLPQEEIVSRLLFGEDAGRIDPAQAVQVAAVIAELQGGGLNVLERLREATGLDTLGISGGTDGGSGSSPGEARLSAGKYLNDDVYLQVEQGVTGDDTRLRAEIDLGSGIKLDSAVDREGGGVELEWRYDF